MCNLTATHAHISHFSTILRIQTWMRQIHGSCFYYYYYLLYALLLLLFIYLLVPAHGVVGKKEVTWLNRIGDMLSYMPYTTHFCVTWLVHLWDMARSYVWRAPSFICVTCPIVHMCDVPYSYVWHDAFKKMIRHIGEEGKDIFVESAGTLRNKCAAIHCNSSQLTATHCN